MKVTGFIQTILVHNMTIYIKSNMLNSSHQNFICRAFDFMLESIKFTFLTETTFHYSLQAKAQI